MINWWELLLPNWNFITAPGWVIFILSICIVILGFTLMFPPLARLGFVGLVVGGMMILGGSFLEKAAYDWELSAGVATVLVLGSIAYVVWRRNR